MSLWKVLKEHMLLHPDSKVIEGEERYTYDQLIQKVEELSQKLDADCYAIHCRSELHAAIAILACFAAKKTAVPLSYRYGGIHSERILKSIRPGCVIADLPGADDSNPDIYITKSGMDGYMQPEIAPALIMCTSGTTGSPKGAMLTEKNILCNLTDIRAYFHINAQDRILIARPLYHCAVLTGELLISLMTGCDIVFCSESFHPLAMFQLIRDERITVMGSTPTLWRAMCMLAHSMKSPIFLRILMVSGENLPPTTADLLRRTFPQSDIYHVYGLTEASPRVAALPPDEFHDFSGTVGYPLASVVYRIVDSQGKNVSDGQIGELIVKGQNIMPGYYSNTGETERVLRDGWLYTGDMASVDVQGHIKIHGRKDRMMIRAGMNIYPSEIENVLRTDERVRELYVYGKPDPMYGEAIVLVISGDFESEKEIRMLCAKLLPSYEQPLHIEWRDKLLYTASGKLVQARG